MSTTTVPIWELLEKSQLLSSAQCQQWRAEIAKENGGKNVVDPKAIADFLVGKNVLSRYQAAVLLAGRAGPFSYGDYKVYDKVDKGRLSGMFRAVHGTTGHPVLLQFLSGPITQNPQSWGMASNEARIATRMVGPHLHRLFDLCDTPKHKFLVWEDLRGQTLEERLASGKLPPSEACRVARQLALALATVHHGGRVHGDIRPINIWCDHAKGGAPSHVRLLRDPMAMPAPLMVHQPDPQGRTLAMADYAAPELQMPGGLPGVLTDVYSVGCVLYQLLSGSPPFPGGDAMQKMSRHANEPPRPLQPLGVPPPIEQLVIYLLAKNPGMRYQDTVSVAEQLSAFVDPAVLKIGPPAPSPTLVAFETQLKQSAVAHAAATPVIPVTAPMPTTSPVPPGTTPPGYAPPGYAPAGYAAHPQAAMPAPAAAPVTIQTDGDSSTVRSSIRRRRKRSLMPLWVTLASLGLFGAAGIAYWMNTKPEQEVVENDPVPANQDQGTESTDNSATAANLSTTGENANSGTAQTASDSAQVQLVADDGKTLWASPTEGAPVDLKYVPPEAQVVFCVRPASMMATSEGPKVLQALGPEFPPVLENFEKASGVKFADLDRLVVSLHNNDGNFPRVACVATMKEGQSAPVWTDVEEDTEGSTKFHKGADWSFWVPKDDGERLFVMAAESDVREVIKSPEPILRREVERLRKSTDDQRHVTVLFYPNFFFNNDSDLVFEGERARGREGLSWLLGEGVQAGAVSLHFDNAFYFEMRAMSKIDKDKRELADDFHKRFDSLPNLMKEYITFQLNPPPYWKLLAGDFPRMIREFHENLRVGVEGDEAVMNCYLPVEAAHNLTLGAELAMATAPGGAPTVATSGKGGYTGPKTLDEAMAKLVISEFSFDQQSLEFAIKDLEKAAQDLAKGAPFPLEIHVLGADLQLDGITKNQSVRDFKQVNVPLGDVLTALAKGAHPKLIWAIGPSPDDPAKTVVLMTTRTQASKKMYKIPDVFKQAPEEKKNDEKKKDDKKKT